MLSNALSKQYADLDNHDNDNEVESIVNSRNKNNKKNLQQQ